MSHQSFTSRVQVLLYFPLHLVHSIFPSISCFAFPSSYKKCPKCCFLSCIVLRCVCVVLAISKTFISVLLSRYDILNMRRKIDISKALILSSICLFSVHDSEAYKKMESTYHLTRRFLIYIYNFRAVNTSLIFINVLLAISIRFLISHSHLPLSVIP